MSRPLDKRIVWALVLLFCLGVWTGVALAVRSAAGGWGILQPPANMTPTPAQMDASREVWVPFAEVAHYCGPNPAPTRDYRGRVRAYRTVLGCYLPRLDVVILPSDWPSRCEVQQLQVHEHAHRVFGWVHP